MSGTVRGGVPPPVTAKGRTSGSLPSGCGEKSKRKGRIEWNANIESVGCVHSFGMCQQSTSVSADFMSALTAKRSIRELWKGGAEVKKKLTPEQENLKRIMDVVSRLESAIAREKLISYGEGMVAAERMMMGK